MNAKPISAQWRQKFAALLAGGLVLGVGGVATLASWTDTEWVFGGNAAGDGPGVGTSDFEVEQNRTQPHDPASAFSSFETNPGGSLLFGLDALALTPGDTVYAPVALRTTTDSVAGTLQLTAAVPASGITVSDSGSALWNALELEVGWVATTGAAGPETCDADGFGDYTAIDLTGTGLGAVPETGTQPLSASGGNVLHYCFKITLPAGASDTLQGRTAAPAWRFDAVSD